MRGHSWQALLLRERQAATETPICQVCSTCKPSAEMQAVLWLAPRWPCRQKSRLRQKAVPWLTEARPLGQCGKHGLCRKLQQVGREAVWTSSRHKTQHLLLGALPLRFPCTYDAVAAGLARQCGTTRQPVRYPVQSERGTCPDSSALLLHQLSLASPPVS